VDDGSENMKEEQMSQFLRPSLVTLQLYGGYYTKWFLEQIKVREKQVEIDIELDLLNSQRNAPSLGALLLDNRNDSYQSADLIIEEDLINFLEGMPSIKHLELMIGWEPALTEKVIIYLMFRSGLEMLRIQSALHCSTLQEALSTNLDLDFFPHLRSLELAAEDRAWRLTLPMLKRLQHADMTVIDCHSPVDLLHSMSSCSRLEELSFSWDHGALTGASLLDLASHCPILRSINFESDDGHLIEISDDVIETLASRLPHLEELIFPSLVGVRLSSKSLASFSRYCPRLSCLDMPVDLEFIELDSGPEQLHFPLLEILDLGLITARHMALEEDYAAWGERIIRLLNKRFPCLISLHFRPTPPYDYASDPLIRRVGKLLLQRPNTPFPRCNVNVNLKSRLIESLPGSRYNPFP
jgi:hypothetical protein